MDITDTEAGDGAGDAISEQRRWTCLKCQGTLKPKHIDLQNGFIVLQFVCQHCHRPYPAGVKPKPLIAA